MRLSIEHGLPFVAGEVRWRGRTLQLSHLLIDTGSASTILAAERLEEIGIAAQPDDAIRRIRGVGGAEFVFVTRIERLSLGGIGVDDLEIEVGEMDYGLRIDGIVGMDVLMAARAIIDLGSHQFGQA